MSHDFLHDSVVFLIGHHHVEVVLKNRIHDCCKHWDRQVAVEVDSEAEESTGFDAYPDLNYVAALAHQSAVVLQEEVPAKEHDEGGEVVKEAAVASSEVLGEYAAGTSVPGVAEVESGMVAGVLVEAGQHMVEDSQVDMDCKEVQVGLQQVGSVAAEAAAVSARPVAHNHWHIHN